MDPVAPTEAAAGSDSITNNEYEEEYAYPIFNAIKPLPPEGIDNPLCPGSDDNVYAEPMSDGYEKPLSHYETMNDGSVGTISSQFENTIPIPSRGVNKKGRAESLV